MTINTTGISKEAMLDRRHLLNENLEKITDDYPKTSVGLNRMLLQKVQHIFIDGKVQFEVVDGIIIRCRRAMYGSAKGRTTNWTENEGALVAHILCTVVESNEARTQAATAGLDVDFKGETYRVFVPHHPADCWVLRRKDGSVYQIHPKYAEAFARKRSVELRQREG